MNYRVGLSWRARRITCLLFFLSSLYFLSYSFSFVTMKNAIDQLPWLQSITPENHPTWIMVGNVWSQNKSLVDCKQLVKGDPKEIARAKTIMKLYPKKSTSSNDFIELAKDCDSFKNKRRYIRKALSKREQEFAISYGIAIYKDVEQFERLLRAIYRPQNFYCVHVDLKSPKRFHQAVANIVNCFPNVILASKFVNVIWGSFTVLEAYLICLRDLLDRFKNWKYFINLTGQEFPLKTNNEIVNDLKSLNGRNLIGGSRPKQSIILKRIGYVWNGAKSTRKKKTPFRYNFQFYKGSVYVVVSRQFANFSLNNHVATEFLEWLKDTGHPDETFFPTLFENVPLHSPTILAERSSKQKPVMIRYVNWGRAKCNGKVVRGVCIHGVGDLKEITKRNALFVNKFNLHFEYLALDCMEEWMYNKTRILYNS